MRGGRSIQKRATLTVLSLVWGCIGCVNFPEVTANTCGNGVVETPEDCDGFTADPMFTCRPRGSTGECHLDCGPRPDGTRPSCPDGWGCDVQGVCRQPTGEFERARESTIGGAWSLMTGDFDGDGRAEVVSLEQPDARGRAKLLFNYFDDQGKVDDTRPFPKLVATPVIGDLSGDGRSDLAFSNFAVGLLLGRDDRTLVPETFGSYHFPDAKVRFSTVYHEPIQDISAVVSLTTIEGVPGLYVPDTAGILRRRGELPGGLDALVGEAVTADVIESPSTSPCREMILAVRGATSFSMIDTCSREALTDQIIWRDPFVVETVALDPPAAIDAPPQIVDMNGDGHLDVLLGAGGRHPYVAYGNGRSLAVATPYRLLFASLAADSAEIPMPLAAGDFSGDGIVDFVFEDYLLISTRTSLGTPPFYRPDQPNEGAPWTVARVVDVNDNGLPDVVAASSRRLGIDVFNGTGTDRVLGFTVPTSQPVLFLTIGDFDGDLINDVAFVEKATSASDRDVVMIGFGGLAGPPLPPVPVARVSDTEQLGVIDQGGITNLFIVSTEMVAGHRNGVLAVLAGSGDRLPFSALQLVSISADSSVFVSTALGVTVGAFSGSGSSDVLALTTDGDPNMHDFHFWMLPALGGPASTAFPVGGELDARLQPAGVNGYHLDVNLVGTTGDFDGDGRDDACWAMPADRGAHCGLVIVGTGPPEAPAVVTRGTIVLDEPCPGAQLAAVDADGDGRPDLILLTGGAGLPNRKLMVLWNDGSGGFATTDASVLNLAGDSPEQFTVLPATHDRSLGVAYVTNRALMLATATATPRQFGLPRTLASVQNGSGVVAADVNGDGVIDLAVAASGNLGVLVGGLRTQ